LIKASENMAAQKGRDLLLKLDGDGEGSFATIAGLRTHNFSLNAHSVDITHQESAGAWRELLAGGGVRSASVRGSGIFRDETSDVRLREMFFSGAIPEWQIAIPSFGIIQGKFQITALEYTGRHDNELCFELALESAGELSFTAL
jgi:TP901-1 family phage major tail protein